MGAIREKEFEALPDLLGPVARARLARCASLAGKSEVESAALLLAELLAEDAAFDPAEYDGNVVPFTPRR